MRLWQELISLSIKSSSISSINIAIDYLDSLLAKFNDIEGFDKMSPET